MVNVAPMKGGTLDEGNNGAMVNVARMVSVACTRLVRSHFFELE
jgi:hypothetical protein